MSKVVSSLPARAINGWMYAYMHVIAECGMFYLQAAVDSSGWTAQRQSQAVNNIAIILEALGERGRQSPLGKYSLIFFCRIKRGDHSDLLFSVMFPLTVITNWQEHLRKTLSPTSSHRMLPDEERLALWWTEIERSWGINHAHGLEPDPRSRSSRTGIPLDHSTSSLGLHYPTSPTPTDLKRLSGMSSSSSTSTLPTPKSYHSHGRRRLLPLRSRPRTSSASLVYPASPTLDAEWISPPRANSYQDHRHLPSLPTVSRDEARDGNFMRDLLPRGGSDIRSTSIFLNEGRNRTVATRREGNPDSKREIEMEGKTDRQRERDVDRGHPYTKDRPGSPLRWRHWPEQVPRAWEQVTDIEEEKQKPRIVGHGLVGIAALVSAAEEKGREEVDLRA